MTRKLGSEHASNLPRDFYKCNHCGKIGVYVMYQPTKTGLRCKYCKHEKWIDKEQFLGLSQEIFLF